MNRLKRGFFLLLMGLAANAAAASDLASFDSAKTAFEENSGCAMSGVLPASYDHGDLANCVIGESRTVVYELEKSTSSEDVKKAKITWFDFGIEPDLSKNDYRVHGDSEVAAQSVEAFVDAYAPCQKEKLQASFFNGEGCQCETADGKFDVIVYQFENPSLTERSVEIRSR